MIILRKQSFKLKESLITEKKSFFNRRNFIMGMGGILASTIIKPGFPKNIDITYDHLYDRPVTKFNIIRKYNNFFEFGTSKQIWKDAQKLNTNDWSIKVIGGKYNNQKIFFEDLYKKFEIEDRTYRFRCVEAWSMVIPWQGFKLSSLIKFLEPDADTKFVEFETFFMPKYAKNQLQSWYPWPYKEIISLPEALNELAFLATGIYGEDLPKQNGAPLRLVLPWKYGFKSIKSITKIRFLKNRTKSFWETIEPKEYGFWANVNPEVPHRRWSQKLEKDVESGKMYPTKIFNGYSEWVQDLYDINDKNLFF